MSAIVEVRNVSKRFGEFSALDNVSFNISPGSIVGLIGPNGAGKTTVLKAILGLAGFDGEMSVFGEDPRTGRHKIMERVCFIADVGVLPRWLKVSDALDYIQGVHPRFNRDRAEFMLAQTKISKRSKVKELSKGMVTQLHLALVMAIEVDLLVLDEPTLGLDILFRKGFYERLLNDYFDNETSVIISTHQVEEIESLLTHLLFINGGQIVLDCPMDEINKIYSEVLVLPNSLQRANSMEPLHSRDILGRKAMIFENVPKERLENLGELYAPSVANLFVAKMYRQQEK
jgi:ABC-2 type transport system ATP-binding protein